MPQKKTQKESEPEEKKHKSFKPLLIKALIALILLLSIFTASFFFVKYKQEQKVAKTLVTQKELSNAELIALVEKLVVLPKEAPAIATVSDVTKLEGQPFFKDAKNGDKVLLFSEAQKAVLFRLGVNKIINIAPFNSTEQSIVSPVVDTTLTPEPKTIKVVILNGTKTAGLTKKAEQVLLSDKSISVVKKDNSVNDYEQTLVVDVTGKNKAAQTSIISLLNGKVATLPQGEVKPEADILILLGTDYAN